MQLKLNEEEGQTNSSSEQDRACRDMTIRARHHWHHWAKQWSINSGRFSVQAQHFCSIPKTPGWSSTTARTRTKRRWGCWRTLPTIWRSSIITESFWKSGRTFKIGLSNELLGIRKRFESSTAMHLSWPTRDDTGWHRKVVYTCLQSLSFSWEYCVGKWTNGKKAWEFSSCQEPRRRILLEIRFGTALQYAQMQKPGSSNGYT